MAEGFLSRWSQRKQAVRAGQPVVEVVKQNTPLALENTGLVATHSVSKLSPAGALVSTPPQTNVTAAVAASASESGLGASRSTGTHSEAPLPTLDDVQALQPADSFARFVARDVSPDVRNAAMKKLFADPHYNVMDGLDIYIDDYSIASPLPAATLRQMASAKFLNLFDEDPSPADAQGTAPASAGEVADTAPATNVAQCAPASDAADTFTAASTDIPLTPLTPVTPAPQTLVASSEDTAHDDPDLRLQPNDAAGCAAFKREPERTPDAAQQPVPPPSC